MTALFGVAAEETTDLVVGEWEVRLTAGATAIDAAGVLVSHRITLD
jgi:hypothetical protein